MSVCAIMLVKDEVDIIGATLDHLWTQVDGIIVADNGSTDGTSEILAASGALVFPDHDPAHYQGRKTTALAREARELGYEWVVPCDADEIWYSPHHARVADALGELDPAYRIATANLYDHYATAYDDADEENPVLRLGWRRREPGGLQKVACRTHWSLTIGEGNHGANYAGLPGLTAEGLLVVRHFPYRSADHFVRKAVRGAEALALTDLIPDVGAHWRGYGDMVKRHGRRAAKDWYRRYFWYPTPDYDPDLIFDPAPVVRSAP